MNGGRIGEQKRKYKDKKKKGRVLGKERIRDGKKENNRDYGCGNVYRFNGM